jgi:hypothetical protein
MCLSPTLLPAYQENTHCPKNLSRVSGGQFRKAESGTEAI